MFNFLNTDVKAVNFPPGTRDNWENADSLFVDKAGRLIIRCPLHRRRWDHPVFSIYHIDFATIALPQYLRDQ
jgi:hypothetical protein